MAVVETVMLGVLGGVAVSVMAAQQHHMEEDSALTEPARNNG